MKFAYRRDQGVTTNRERLLRKAIRDGVGVYDAPEISPMQAVWLAAMLDAEGHLSLHKHKKGNYYFPVIGVSNNHAGLIARVVEIVGARWTVVREHKTRPGYRRLKVVTVARLAMADVLRSVRPYLIAKGRQADILSQFCLQHEGRPCGSPPAENVAEMFATMKDLNRRGIREGGWNESNA